jgi:membrane protein involved in colicin uptake
MDYFTAPHARCTSPLDSVEKTSRREQQQQKSWYRQESEELQPLFRAPQTKRESHKKKKRVEAGKRKTEEEKLELGRTVVLLAALRPQRSSSP